MRQARAEHAALSAERGLSAIGVLREIPTAPESLVASLVAYAMKLAGQAHRHACLARPDLAPPDSYQETVAAWKARTR